MLKSAFAVTLSLTPYTPALPPLPSAMLPPGVLPFIREDGTSARCPVCGSDIPIGKGSKVTVRNREYRVDDGACGEALAANPDKYLEPDGTPKNAKK